MEIQRAVEILATPRMSEDEAIARSLDEGVATVPLSPESFIISGSAGQFLYEGLGLTSESFCNDPLGLLNITKAWQHLQRVGAFEPRRLPIEANLLNQLSGIEVDRSVVKKIDAEMRSMPILFGMDSAHAAYLIDGAHRLSSRVQHGETSVQAYLLNPKATAYIRARVFRIDDDGAKIEIETTKGHTALQRALRLAS